jgi:hypothetical protein
VKFNSTGRFFSAANALACSKSVSHPDWPAEALGGPVKELCCELSHPSNQTTVAAAKREIGNNRFIGNATFVRRLYSRSGAIAPTSFGGSAAHHQRKISWNNSMIAEVAKNHAKKRQPEFATGNYQELQAQLARAVFSILQLHADRACSYVWIVAERDLYSADT